MKKIFPLLFVLLLDFVFLTAADEAKQIIPTPFFPLILLFATLVVTLLLFYDRQTMAMQLEWIRFRKENDPETVQLEPEIVELAQPALVVEKTKSIKPNIKPKLKLSLGTKKPKNLSLDMQYQFIDLVRQEILELRKNEKSDGEIVKQLHAEQWDPQVIYIALSRTKKPEKAG